MLIIIVKQGFVFNLGFIVMFLVLFIMFQNILFLLNIQLLYFWCVGRVGIEEKGIMSM